MMGSRVRPTRITCVNCSICVNKLRRYPALALDPRVTTLICNWVYPQIVLEDNYVCEACRDRAIAAVNRNIHGTIPGSGDSGSSTRKRTNVCLLCGCSIQQKQSDLILKENPTEMQQSIINIIKSRLAPREICSSDRVCHACWLRTKREVVRIGQHNENRPLQDILNIDVKHENPPQPLDDSVREQGPLQDILYIDVKHENPPQPSDESVRSKQAPTVDTPRIVLPDYTQRIVLPDYRRAANSTHNCVFPNCNSTTFHSITDKLRATILHNHNYYVPKLARVCSEHLSNNSWDTLYASVNSIDMFTVEQIQHIFSFVNSFNPSLDFENIKDMDERVFHYLLGITKEKFNSLLEEVPRIVELRRGSLGLAACLLKLRTGDSDERISSLVQVPRRTLEPLMDNVREILCQDFVSRHPHLSMNNYCHIT